VRHFDDEAVSMVSPALRLPSGDIQDSARVIPLPLDLAMRRWAGQATSGALRPTRPVDVPWVVGAFMMLRREAFEDVDGFYPGFRMYFEDVDLCVSMRAHGWKVRHDPSVVFLHAHRAASRKQLLSWSARQHVRSAAIFYRRHPRALVTRHVYEPPAIHLLPGQPSTRANQGRPMVRLRAPA
jgi:GT2 family glycosyltransferase